VSIRGPGWFYADRQTSGIVALLWPEGCDLSQALLEQGFDGGAYLDLSSHVEETD